MSNLSFRTVEVVKNQDIYGQPINLNFNGEDTFKTCPGGLISLVLFVFLVMYTFLKSRYMINREKWTLIQQTVVADSDELMQAYNFADEKF